MKKRMLLVISMILLILALAVVPALAESGIAKKGPPEDPPDIPEEGELYGDLYVVLRDVNGAPIPDANGCIQPIAGVDASAYIAVIDETITVSAGEPFQLLTYFDSEGILEECELAEEMADWVQTVDFGRLNLGRAPDAVIDHALDEAIFKMNAACDMGLDPSGRIMLEVEENCDDGVVDWITIDAPAENLALYIKMMMDGDWIIPEGTSTSRKGGDPKADDELRPVLSVGAKDLINGLGYTHLTVANSTIADLTVHELQLAASLMAGAGDKFGTITLDMVVYINSIYGINQAAGGYFNFGAFQYDRAVLYGNRPSVGTNCGVGEVYVLQLEEGTTATYTAGCVPIMDFVLFNDYSEVYATEGVDDYPVYSTNVRGFTQAADDALQVLEYVHNYAVPEALPSP